MLPIALLALAALGMGCAPAIGDSCTSSVDCSLNGDRVCDTAEPGGYCTIQACDPDTCPSEATCVAFRAMHPRTESQWCMFKCNTDSDCRSGYVCDRAAQVTEGDGGPQIAKVLDTGRANQAFCVFAKP